MKSIDLAIKYQLTYLNLKLLILHDIFFQPFTITP